MNARVQDYAELLTEYRARAFDEPAWFFDEVLRFPLDDWQLFAIEAVADVHRPPARRRVNKRGLNDIAIVSCHGTGKTQFIAATGHWWNFVFYGLAVVTAPKQDQLRTRFMPRYRLALRGAIDWYRSLVHADTLKTSVANDPDWGLICETAAEDTSLAGYHDNPQLFLVDEASSRRIDPLIPTIEGTLSTPGSVVVKIGNGTRASGDFYSSHNKKGVKELVFRMQIIPRSAPADVISRARKRPGVHVFYSDRAPKDWVQRYIRKYGKDSPVTKVRAFGEFADSEKNQLIAMDWVTDAREREFKEDGSVPALVVSGDAADGGDDFNVITVARLYQTTDHYLRQTKHSFPEAKAPIMLGKALAKTFDAWGGDKAGGRDYIVVDALGPGSGAAGWLIEHKYPVVVYKGGAASDDPKQWRNRRVQSHIAYRDAHRDGRVVYAPDFTEDEAEWDEYMDQVSWIRTREGEERLEDLEPKRSLIQRTNKSPDRVDSAVMVYATQVPVLPSGGMDAIIEGEELEAAYEAW